MPEWTRGSSTVTGRPSRARSRPSQVRQRVGEAVDVAQRAGEVEGRIELRGVERHLGVGLEDLAEGVPLGPGPPGVALHDPVRLVAGQAGGDEGEQDGL